MTTQVEKKFISIDADEERSFDILYETLSISYFLENNRYFFIVAPKGYGKTLALRKKSQLFRDKGFKCYPTASLLTRFCTCFVKENIDDYISFNSGQWGEVWERFFLVYLCHAFLNEKDNAPFMLPITLEGLNKHGLRANPMDLLVDILHGSKHTIDQKFQDGTSQYLKFFDEIYTAFEGLQSDVSIFFDGVDELFSPNTPEGVSLWKNIQVGFRNAVLSLYRRNRRIKIYSTMRQECFSVELGALALQTQGYSVKIDYTHEQLYGILTNHLKKHSNSTTADEHIISEYFKQDNILNQSTQETENVFQYILRHTFRAPKRPAYYGKNFRRNTR